MNKDSKPKRRSPVKKFMDKFHKPKTHRDKTKYWRKGLNLPVNELPEVFDKQRVRTNGSDDIRDGLEEIMQGFDDLELDKSLYEPEQENGKEDT